MHMGWVQRAYERTNVVMRIRSPVRGTNKVSTGAKPNRHVLSLGSHLLNLLS